MLPILTRNELEEEVQPDEKQLTWEDLKRQMMPGYDTTETAQPREEESPQTSP